ncbi:glycosyltransferase family 4 protein [Patescibacteria group bacterium]|nr:glycosyltransferase family 4 protein [Patescibacteria group bacterium]
MSQELAKALRANKVRCDGVIYNGLEPNDFSETDLLSRKSFKNKYSLASKKVIFYGGRLSFAKGTDQLLVVWPLIRNKVSEVVLLVAGDEAGYVKKALFQRQKDIIFTGWLNEQEMRVVYSLSDLVVFPSLYLEPFGLIVIEAMASKKPVVGTCFGGVKEIVIDGQTGFIANPINKEEFAEKISSILSDEELAKKMGERGLEIVRERFDIKKTAQHYLLELKNLIKSRN